MARLVVMKLGSSIVADEGGELRADVIDGVCAEVARLYEAGDDVVMVTSGRSPAGCA